MEVGEWARTPGLTRIFVFKSSQNSPKPVLIFWSSIPLCILSVYALLKVVGYYDLRDMSVMGFQKLKSLDWGGWVGELCPILFGIFGNFFNFAKLLTPQESCTKKDI